MLKRSASCEEVNRHQLDKQQVNKNDIYKFEGSMGKMPDELCDNHSYSLRDAGYLCFSKTSGYLYDVIPRCIDSKQKFIWCDYHQSSIQLSNPIGWLMKWLAWLVGSNKGDALETGKLITMD